MQKNLIISPQKVSVLFQILDNKVQENSKKRINQQGSYHSG